MFIYIVLYCFSHYLYLDYTIQKRLVELDARQLFKVRLQDFRDVICQENTR